MKGEFVMKTLRFRRVCLAIGLALCIMVVWSAAAPSAMGVGSRIGGWVGTTWAYCCFNTSPCYCDDGEGAWFGCAHIDQVCCYWAGTPTSKNCSAKPSTDPCGDGALLCHTIHDAQCT